MKPRGSRRERKWQGPQATPQSGFYITGLNGLRECILSKSVYVSRIWIDGEPKSWLSRNLPEIPSWPIEPEQAQEGASPFGPLSQGCGILVKPPIWGDWDDLARTQRSSFVVVLDQIEDPMNLGQIIRTCEGAGVDALLLPDRRSVQLNQTAAQVSQGAFAWLPVLNVGNLRRALDLAKDQGFWIVGAESVEESVPWNKVDYRERVCLVLGSEGRGLRRLTREICDHLVNLPMKGHVNSLNVSAASAALIYEVMRQRSGE